MHRSRRPKVTYGQDEYHIIHMRAPGQLYRSMMHVYALCMRACTYAHACMYALFGSAWIQVLQVYLLYRQAKDARKHTLTHMHGLESRPARDGLQAGPVLLVQSKAACQKQAEESDQLLRKAQRFHRRQERRRRIIKV
jgi:hypothetical protein